MAPLERREATLKGDAISTNLHALGAVTKCYSKRRPLVAILHIKLKCLILSGTQSVLEVPVVCWRHTGPLNQKLLLTWPVDHDLSGGGGLVLECHPSPSLQQQ